MHSCSSVCVLLCVCCFFYLISTQVNCAGRCPLGTSRVTWPPLVRISHLSKSNCTVEKLNCAHMIMQEQRQSKALSLKDFEASQQSKYIFKEDRLFRAAGRWSFVRMPNCKRDKTYSCMISPRKKELKFCKRGKKIQSLFLELKQHHLLDVSPPLSSTQKYLHKIWTGWLEISCTQ